LPSSLSPAAGARSLQPEDQRRSDDSSVDRLAIDTAVDAVFGAAGTESDTGTRAVVVLHRGQRVAERYAAGFDERTPQLGWSMSKTVLGLLSPVQDHQKLKDQGREPTTRALDWVAPARRPAWLASWEPDTRSAITIEDLLLMRDGLEHEEGYAPWSAVPRMLWGVDDVAAFAGSAAAEVPAGSRFRYLSATTNILSALLRAQFEDDAAYWRYPYEALFEPIGAHSAVLEADASGNFVASSYLWATPHDWARIGEVLRLDGLVGERRVRAPGWRHYASNPPAIDDGPAAGYGAHVWLAGAARGSTCGPDHGLPADTLMMAGHWGQVVAAVPSREAVIVRLGITLERGRFSRCAFIRSVLAALPGDGADNRNGR
jgi:CubicO group peptidase (beta-lactamase class C family)